MHDPMARHDDRERVGGIAVQRLHRHGRGVRQLAVDHDPAGCDGTSSSCTLGEPWRQRHARPDGRMCDDVRRSTSNGGGRVSRAAHAHR